MDKVARLKDDVDTVCANPASMPSTHLLAGALAHLAQHMETGCPRAAYLAAMLLERIGADPKAEPHLRAHARQLVDILERDPVQAWASEAQAGALARSNRPRLSGQRGLL